MPTNSDRPITGSSADSIGLLLKVRKNMETVMGPLPAVEREVPLHMATKSTEELGGFTRHLVSFATEPGDRIAAYLLVPKQPKKKDGKVPAMLCLHQTTPFKKSEPAGLVGNPNFHYAAHLAERGYITLAPDYALGRNFEAPGVSLFDPYAHGYASATMKGIWNHKVALEVLARTPGVDAGRMGVIGHSLGGHNALFLAMFEDRVKLIVSSCGFTRFNPEGGSSNISDWSHSGYMPRIRTQYDCDGSRMPFDFPDILSALAPRPFFTNSPENDNFRVDSVRQCLNIARHQYRALEAEEKLQAVHPPCGHDFPADAREAAYAFIDRWL